jgi:hypothetical protein
MTHSSETSTPLARWFPFLGGTDLTFTEDSVGVGSVTASIAFNDASPTLLCKRIKPVCDFLEEIAFHFLAMPIQKTYPDT